jgi:ubiquinone/menaquinone biosynthesis C-methylase UbiE
VVAHYETRNARKTMALLEEVPGASSVLVVGCGDGREAGIIADHLGAATVGIGLDASRFDLKAAGPATLREMDARALQFEDASFDLVYSFHALEHIPTPERALAEIRRVLTKGGRFIIGTPNKSRLIGSITSAEPVLTRIVSNVRDYRMRLAGRWSNEAGAHAGFTRQELQDMCSRLVGPAIDITDSYYERLYPGRERQLAILRSTRLAERVYPAVYVFGERS